MFYIQLRPQIDMDTHDFWMLTGKEGGELTLWSLQGAVFDS